MPYIPGGGRISDVYRSGNVYANSVPVALWLSPGGGGAFALSALLDIVNSPEYEQEKEVQEAVEGETENEYAVAREQKKLVEAGVISQSALNQGNGAGATPAASDTTAGTANTGTAETAALDITSVDETVLYTYPPDPDATESNPRTIKVKDVTKVPGVVFPYDVSSIAAQNGIAVQEVCNNLKALITYCWVPIKEQFPDAFITCSFRKGGVGSPTSQHPKGMAMDIQYGKIGSWTGSTKDPYPGPDSYFTRAQWIRDNVPYDQFLLEYKTTGTKLPWHHISYTTANRGQVSTFMNNKNCKGPGVQGLFDLSNA
jgi:hypothetical protein